VRKADAPIVSTPDLSFLSSDPPVTEKPEEKRQLSFREDPFSAIA
jgi:hypothetical protein